MVTQLFRAASRPSTDPITALEALAGNASRSGLTALGIIIGVGVPVMMMVIGDGATRVDPGCASGVLNLTMVIVMLVSATVAVARASGSGRNDDA